MQSYAEASGVIQIDYKHDANSSGFCSFNLAPRFADQADLVDYDYIIIRAFVPLGNDNLIRFSLGFPCLTPGLGMYTCNIYAPETMNWNNTDCKGFWYEFKIDLNAAEDVEGKTFKSLLDKDGIMSLELYVQGDCTIYIDSIMAGKNA